MATKKKNSNYQTEKTAQKQAEQASKIKAKATKRTVLACVFTALFLTAVILSGFLFGLFEYVPKATSHASITLSDGTQLHAELYGKDAPITVAHIEKLAGASYFTGKRIISYENGAIYLGDDDKGNSSLGIKGEFKENGVKNKVAFTKGTIVMSRDADHNTGYGQFFILTEDRPDLEGKYAAFGFVTDGLDKLIETLEGGGVYYENGTDGKIVAGAPTINSFSSHASH
jgi:peptidyl-prolyl cis-trans isomerase B (cyclophilin B)